MTDSGALVEGLRGRGVVLEGDGDRLLVDAPAGELNDTDRVDLVTNKAALLRYLRAPKTTDCGVDQGRGDAQVAGVRSVTHLLVLVPHDHSCLCGLRFKCTAPSCAGADILCVCCKLDRIETRSRAC